jgi:2-polyprenyl-6-methoxyphenol hydroxylase-like FAD-dependent oxidoreductase
MHDHRTSVAIIGGGPVGLLLALFLDRHGVRSTVFNTEASSRFHPKGNTHNSRTMEHYRRLGISQAIRALGLPPDHPRDIAYFTRCNAWELARFRFPSEAERQRELSRDPATAQVPEPLLRANQMYVERFLLDHARQKANITLRFGWNVSGVRQDPEGVEVDAESSDGQSKERWRAQFGVGADGGRSFVRRTLGIGYQGQSAAEQPFLGGAMISTHVAVPSLHRDILAHRKSWMYNVVARDLRLLLISLDGADEFVLMTKAEHPDRNPDDAAIIDAVQRGIGSPVSVSVIAHRAWTGGIALVAERFALGRLFLVGDASHLFSPTGGLGMNTGIDGAANLAWKLAAAVQGWAGSELLSSYECERRVVALRNTAAARSLTERVGALVIPTALEESTPLGADARAQLAVQLMALRPQFDSPGVELGARYDESPIVHRDGEPPEPRLLEYQPSSVPGGRAPHLWCDSASGRRTSLFDHLGIGFTLLRIGAEAPDPAALETMAKLKRIPLTVLSLPLQPAWELYQRRLVLIRPDQHVAWRGDQFADDMAAVLDRCVGGPTKYRLDSSRESSKRTTREWSM